MVTFKGLSSRIFWTFMLFSARTYLARVKVGKPRGLGGQSGIIHWSPALTFFHTDGHVDLGWKWGWLEVRNWKFHVGSLCVCLLKYSYSPRGKRCISESYILKNAKCRLMFSSNLGVKCVIHRCLEELWNLSVSIYLGKRVWFRTWTSEPDCLGWNPSCSICWTNYPTTPGLTFSICKVGIKVVPTSWNYED